MKTKIEFQNKVVEYIEPTENVIYVKLYAEEVKVIAMSAFAKFVREEK